MREKENTNLKNKINLKNLLVKKTQPSFNMQSINIQTITKDKTQNYFNEDKKFIPKLSNKIRYLNTSLTNNNINNNYLLNEDQISFFSFYNSNKEPSPINSLNSSPYSTYTQKKRNYKRLQKRYKHKYNNFNINSSNSINNLSLNSKIINTNQSVSLNSSSSSSSYNDCSDSSDFSYRSRENKRKNYKEIMMAEEDDLDYLKKREVGLVSSDDEDNTNSIDNNNSLEENFSNEIERILIEIYNKNISIISSGNYSDLNKNKSEIEDIEKQIKKYLKKKNFKTNLLVLKCLSNKIKELVGKYKEKVFEIEEIKTIYDISKLKMQSLRNNQILHSNNSVGSNVTTNSNSSYDSGNYNNYNYDEENFLKNNILKVQDEVRGKGISNILLRELINIKKTLKISSKEIEGIFKYPLNLLKNENGKKIKFSIELMQSEEFCKTLLNDDFIYTLLSQMKGIFTQITIPNMTQWIEEVLEDCDHKNEMTRFVKYINEKLGITNENNDNNKNEINNYLDKIKKGPINNNMLEEQIGKITTFSLDTASSIEGIQYENEKLVNNKNSDEFVEININNNIKNSNKKSKKKKQNNDENENKNINHKMSFKDIDELLNYINDETDSKKGKKKGKKGKKNKKQNNTNKEKDTENNLLKNNDNNNDNNNNDDDNNDEDFEKIFEDFKRDIENNTVYRYDINKIKANLSNDFINNKCSN